MLRHASPADAGALRRTPSQCHGGPMSDEGEGPGKSDSEREDDRLALGMAVGLPIGVALAILFDQWAYLGVGIALGAALGATSWGDDDSDDVLEPGPPDDPQESDGR